MARDTTSAIIPDDAEVALLALEDIPVAVALIDSSTFEIVSTNANFRKSCTSQSVSGKGVIDCVHPDERSRLRDYLQVVAAGDDAGGALELRFGPDGQVEYPRMFIAATLLSASAEGMPARILLSIIDIVHWKEKETRTAARERLWNYALVSSGLGVWDHDYRAGAYFYSPTWRTIRGLPVNGDLHFSSTTEWLQSIHPDDRDFVAEAIEKQKLGDPRFMNFEYREKHADGHWMWIECRGDAVEFFDDNRPARVVGTDRDISDRKTSEALLTRTRQRLELALKTSQIGVFEHNRSTGDVSVDDRLSEIWGFTDHPETVPFSRFTALIHPDDRHRALEKRLAAGGDDIPVEDEFRIFRESDGALRHVRHLVTSQKNAEGIEYLVGINWDVTEETRLRQDLVTAKQLAEARNFELERARYDVENAALHDYLTALPNRRFLEEELARRIEIESTSGFALMLVDIDAFKLVNNTYGLSGGDSVLNHVAQVLLHVSKHNDFVARIGADEFVLVSSYECGTDALESTARRILLEISKHFEIDGTRCKISACIGVATVEQSVEKTASGLLKESDIAVRRAKSEGPNRIVFFERGLQAAAVASRAPADALIEAVENDAFVPFYQPQYDARTRTLAGVETLARWRRPDGTFGEPGSFIPLAETLNLMTLIDTSILRQALNDYGRLSQLGIAPPRLSLNLSPRRLSDPALIASLQEIDLLPEGRLAFELLESIFLDDQDDVSAYNLREIRRLGIDIDVDDFGTGYTSISGLLKVMPNGLKIARELVLPLVLSREQRAIIKSIVDIGRALDIRVIAEGVETEQHADILTELGCDTLQGFWLARPMPYEALSALLVDENAKPAPPPRTTARKR
ncbi:sensor domain-containing protein [Martelella endophytica]|uniref:Diguanylate cyclase n=1 Tax=Martelella endophytica TaxID=1486262 RepID=A0A0D5LQR5_MAREN|nr:bifunctional diguanylate cyclase/phosphodiesterase [Martelella endophytica]AJY46564.1 hypothetical protein TM49_14200 [Martelella endophytica]